MIDIDQIKNLLQAIVDKHGSACAFTISSYGEGYGSYIARDLFPNHRHHETVEEAVERLQAFLDIEDLDRYSKETATKKLHRLREQKEFIEDQMEELRRVLDE